MQRGGAPALADREPCRGGRGRPFDVLRRRVCERCRASAADLASVHEKRQRETRVCGDMTIDEAFHRILRGHWLIILSCIVVPLSAAVLLGRSDADLYEAMARVQMGRDLAASNVQADATSQRVLGIATSPGVVRAALDKAGLQADVAGFAANHIDVRRVGVSPVMEIAVTDTSPRSSRHHRRLADLGRDPVLQCRRPADGRAAPQGGEVAARRTEQVSAAAGVQALPRLAR